MVFRYKHRANLSFFPENSEMTSFITESISGFNRASDVALRSGALSLFMLLKLRSATNVDTGYLKSVLTATSVNSRVKFWVGEVQRFHQVLGNAIFNQRPTLTDDN